MPKTILESKIDLSQTINLEYCKIIKLKNNYYLLTTNPPAKCCTKLKQLIQTGQANLKIIGENPLTNTFIKIFMDKNKGFIIKEIKPIEHYRIKNAHYYLINYKYVDWDCYNQEDTLSIILTPTNYGAKHGHYSLETIIKMYEELTGDKILKTPKEEHILNLLTKDFNTLIKEKLKKPKQPTLTQWFTKKQTQEPKQPPEPTTLNYTPEELTNSKYKRQLYAIISNLYNNLNPKTPLINIPEEERKFRELVEKDTKLITNTLHNNLHELITGTLTPFDKALQQTNFEEVSIWGLKLKTQHGTQLHPILTGFKYKDNYLLFGWPLTLIESARNKTDVKEALQQANIKWNPENVSKAYIDELYKISNKKLRIIIPEHHFNCKNMMEKRFNCILKEIIKNNLTKYPVLKFRDDYVIYGLFMYTHTRGLILEENIYQRASSLKNRETYYYNGAIRSFQKV